MKTLLTAVNAKYIHSNPAVRCLKEYAELHHRSNIGTIEIAEFTINQPIESILAGIIRHKPDIIGFSCYIWNYEYIKKISGSLRRILPNAFILLGGPEVSYHCERALTECRANYCISGEGEVLFTRLLEGIIAGHPPKDAILGHGYGDNTVSLDDIPFIYHDMADYQNRIIYYESSRGCPFRCSYCLSSIKGHDAPVRYLPMERVKSDLRFFLENKVRQVKFVDRTFNCDKARALEMIEFIKEHDNGITNFHFEVAAELLDDALISSLQRARFELFQLEIGVQSTNPPTLRAIHRFTAPDKLQTIITRLQKNKNIHLHLDLIAGLPYESVTEFSSSFNFVYSLKPQQFQLGFLKVLAGSEMEQKAEQYGIVYADYPPYEVLFTRDLPYDQVQRLKMVEHVLELYYNSGRFEKSMQFMEQFYAETNRTAFNLYDDLGAYFVQNGYAERSQNQISLYNILHDFLLAQKPKKTKLLWFNDCVRYDICSHEKLKKTPAWLSTALTREQHERFLAILGDQDFRQTQFAGTEYAKMDSKQLIRLFELQYFTRNLQTGEDVLEYACFFHYQKPDLYGNANVTIISL